MLNTTYTAYNSTMGVQGILIRSRRPSIARSSPCCRSLPVQSINSQRRLSRRRCSARAQDRREWNAQISNENYISQSVITERDYQASSEAPLLTPHKPNLLRQGIRTIHAMCYIHFSSRAQILEWTPAEAYKGTSWLLDRIPLNLDHTSRRRQGCGSTRPSSSCGRILRA
jgi:hypothetical protein